MRIWVGYSWFRVVTFSGLRHVAVFWNTIDWLKFKHSFQHSLNSFCNCSVDIKSTAHYFLHCPTYNTERRTFLSTIENIENNLLNLSEPVLIKTLPFGSSSFDANPNTNVLSATIEYVLSIKRFEEPLFQWSQ